MKTKISIVVGLLLVIALVYVTNTSNNTNIKIGVITPLTGNSAYWGESTQVGIAMAQAKLKEEGINIDFITQDGRLDPIAALSAAQKMVAIDKVNAIYSEFNPASISVSSFLKDKNVFHLYDSAATSPLNNGPYNFKTYLDYDQSCHDVAEYIKNNKGVKKVGILQMNIEHGILCTEGIKRVFGDNVVVETYNSGDTDFKTKLLKLKQNGVDVIYHSSFQEETLTSLKQMQDLKINKLFVGLAETITPDAMEKFGPLIEGDIFFGLPDIDPNLKEQIKTINGGKDVGNYNAAALAYTHLVQLGEALSQCKLVNDCVEKEMNGAAPVPTIGFEGFTDRIAKFKTAILEVKDSQFVEVK